MNYFLKRFLQKPIIEYNEHFRKASYSQCGEDIIVKYVFELRGIRNPSYIDIGANDPFYLNNTAIFYNSRCRGINIEANPKLMPLFEEQRPEDINLNVGIGEKDGELDFFIMEDSTLSTFSKTECEYLIKNGQKLSIVQKIKVTTVSKILLAHFNNISPDFLSIDVEGIDFEILKTIDFFKHSPKIICVEAAEYSPIGAGVRRDELIAFLESKNYYEYANTNLNAIMVRKDFWFV